MKVAYLSLVRMVVSSADDALEDILSEEEKQSNILPIGNFLNRDYPLHGTLFPTFELANQAQDNTLDVLRKGILYIDVDKYNEILTKEILEQYVMEEPDNLVGTLYPKE